MSGTVFEIDATVKPIPDVRRRERKYYFPIKQMKVGDSITVKTETVFESHRVRGHFDKVATGYRDMGWRFVSRTTKAPETITFWRTA